MAYIVRLANKTDQAITDGHTAHVADGGQLIVRDGGGRNVAVFNSAAWIKAVRDDQITDES